MTKQKIALKDKYRGFKYNPYKVDVIIEKK